jgi:four helix bundle protein
MKIKYHWQLDVYKLSVEAAMQIFELSKLFPREETFSLTDQIRRSSRSVSGQISEGWRRRKYKAAFINKLNESEGEAAETQSWIEFSVKCKYVNRKPGEDLHNKYHIIIGQLVNMGNNPDKWILQQTKQIKKESSKLGSRKV